MKSGSSRARQAKTRASWILWFSLVLLIGSCKAFEQGSTCNLKAQGLRGDPWNGSQLGEHKLSLAFLRGPNTVTSDIGIFLEQRSIQATFFVKGSNVEAHRDVLRDLRDEGHLIGNGGYSFTPLGHSKEPVLEARKTDALISPFVTGDMFLLYAPDGDFDQDLAALFNRNGLGKYLGPIQPDTSPGETFMDDASCWETDLSVASCAQQYFNEIVRLQKGLVAFHDEDTRTLTLLDTLLPDLTAFGFSFVRADQVPDMRAALEEGGSNIDQVAAASSCDDYK